MDISTVDYQEYADLFPQLSNDSNKGPNIATFGSEEGDTNLFDPKPVVEEKVDEKKPEEEKVEDKEEANILDAPKKKTTEVNTFGDASSYFQDRLTSGKFIGITEELEDGTKRPFVPKNAEEYDEVIDIQVNYRLEQKEKELESKIYESKSPAWQAVLKYAEMTDDPTEVIPFIQGIRNIESVSSIDENEIDGAEEIVRARMLQTNQPEDVIETNIEALKTTDKLIETAKKLKPIILAQEKQDLLNMKRQKAEEESRYMQMVDNVKENVIKSLEQPIFGKQKLKAEDKQAIYNLIGTPDASSRGYRIFSEIDKLFEKGDFEKLRKISLLLAREESLMTYASNSTADKVAEGLQRKLRVATDNRSSTNDEETESKATISRKQYSSTARFGR